ncbi:DUF2867 domain-containing protein [Algoriphagus sp.]|uniref:DUF2867 domain-containing protein n=1 Tax=Algoriphagus sp. TaxID=1872435 RepID=UPI003F6E46C9
MKAVKEVDTPAEYLEMGILDRVDFSDTFSTTNHQDDLPEISRLVFAQSPKWILWLFSLRNKLVGIIGLETKLPEDYHSRFEVGGYVGFFKIFSTSPQRIVLGADDSHLNFRAVISDTGTSFFNIQVVTLVEYNNNWGRIYMGLIMPFHRIVVKSLVRNAFKHVDKWK